MKSGFLEKLVSRIDRVEPGEVQQIVTRLIQERGFLEKVFQSLQDGIIVLDPDGKISFINRAACAFFGLNADDSTGESIHSQIRGLNWNAIARPGLSVNRDLEIHYPDHRYLNFYLSPIDSGDEARPVGYVMLIRDLTSTRRETEETLETERMNALTLLAAGVAHEIGNPLNSLDIHLQLLGRKFRKLPPGERKPLEEHLATARSEIQRLDGILRQFLQAIRPTVPQRERESLNDIIHETLRPLEPELRARHTAVTLDLDENLPLASVDRGQMQQAFYNLLRNAHQAIAGDHGKITVLTRANEHEFLIAIEDNGSGISPEHLGSLFEPYRTTKANGSGLGLLIVRRIIREHGGEISVASQVNEGTRVVIHLPRAERSVRLLGAPDSGPSPE